jgi:hypothetical protein
MIELALAAALAPSIPTNTPSPTDPAFQAGWQAGIRDSLADVEEHFALTRQWWFVTATATSTPTTTPAPTYHAEATCVAQGHQWTGDWKKLYNPKGRLLGDRDWPTKAHLQISVEVTEPDHDAAWYHTAERCLRCKFWRRKP